MAAPVQGLTTLLTHAVITNADTAAGKTVVGVEVDVRTWISAIVYVYHANVEELANDPSASYTLQARWSTSAGVGEDWADVWTFTAGTVVPQGILLNGGGEAIGQVTIAVAETPVTNFLMGSTIYIQDASVVTDGEWHTVSHLSATVCTINDGLETAKDDSDLIWNQAEAFVGAVDLTGMSWVRMVAQIGDLAADGSDTHHKAHMVRMTDFT